MLPGLFTSLARAMAQLSDPPLLRVVIGSVLAAAVLFLLLSLGIGWTLSALQFFENEWLDRVARLVGGAAAIALAWLLYPAFLPLIMSLFLDSVADAVERRHYPDLPPGRNSGIGEAVLTGLRFAVVLIGLNLLALPLYLFLPGANLVLFYLLNGYLLGREYLEQVALRHDTPAQAARLRGLHRGQLLAAGALIAFGASVPLLNLVVPVLATAFMVHVYHGLRRPVRAV